jgi:dinuclear metal center YbgI/SA1388 family protein
VPTVDDIASALALRTNPGQAPDWDPVGVQLGDRDAEVGSIAVCHEVNEEVVSRLELSPVDLVVTYHPLLFTPTNRVLAGRSAGARSYRLIRAGVTLLVTHTDFDASPGGTADALAAFFRLRDVKPFGGDPEAGLADIGRYGGFEGSLGTIDAIVADAFGPIGIRISGDRDMAVESVAVVPGSGSAFVEAASTKAQVLVTGDVSHHRAVEARDRGLAIVDPGHVATERPGMAALVSLVREVAEVDVYDMTDIDPRTWT